MLSNQAQGDELGPCYLVWSLRQGLEEGKSPDVRQTSHNHSMALPLQSVNQENIQETPRQQPGASHPCFPVPNPPPHVHSSGLVVGIWTQMVTSYSCQGTDFKLAFWPFLS